MREIKFRAWDEEEKVMIQWDALRIEKDTDDPKISVVVFDGPEGSYFDDFQLLQYTGLTDKNGVEIYEGDILTSEEYPYQDEGVYNYHGIVEYAEEIAAFVSVKRVVNQKKRGISDGMADYFEGVENFEVIGNIYENSELLEESK